MLSGLKIKELIKEEKIYIENFEQLTLNPNSVDLTLNEKIFYYPKNSHRILDSKYPEFNKNALKELEKSVKGNYLLEPGVLYLATVNEEIDLKLELLTTHIGGKSSLARLGLQVHMTAAYGNLGFKGRYVLELSTMNLLLVYPDMPICQLFIERVEPDSNGNVEFYKGRYQEQKETMI